MLKVGYKRTLRAEDMYKLNDTQKTEVIYQRFLRILENDVKAHRCKLRAKKSNDEDKQTKGLSKEAHLSGDKAHSPTLKLITEGSSGDEVAIIGEKSGNRKHSVHSEPTKDETPAVPPSVLIKAIFKTFWFEYLVGTTEIMAMNIASTLLPLLQKALTNFVEEKVEGIPVNMGKGIGYAIGCCFMVLFIGLTINHYFYHAMMVGAETKAVLTKVILEKSYRLDAKGHHNFPTGKITSIMSTDLNRIDLAMSFMPFLVIFPVPVAICVALLIINIGVSSLVGIAIFVISTIMLGLSIGKLMYYRERANKFTDMRVNLTKELLKDFKMIKFYSWENSYKDRLTKIRGKEMSFVLLLQNLRNILTAYVMCLPTLSSMVAFCVLYAMSSKRSIGDIFSSLSLFSALANQFSMLPMALAVSTDFLMGMRRCAALLSCGEVSLDGDKPEELGSTDLALKVVNGNFYWQMFGAATEEDQKKKHKPKEKLGARLLQKLHLKKNKEISSSDEDTDTINGTDSMSSSFLKDHPSSDSEESISSTTFPGLKNLNFEVKKGEFIAVTGHIGSGKSSLLDALAGFMAKESGHVYCNGSLMLCGSPWVQNTSIRNNITFGRPFDRQKYSEIVDACCLEDDFKLLPGGDNTEVGERGVTLSGGQKARINLARAVYADKDIILLDDVLSAVDAKVGKKIMERCVMGLLRSKTRILATHQLSLIGSVDRLIFLNGDGTVDVGTMEEVMARNEGLVKLMEYSGEEEEKMKKVKEGQGMEDENFSGDVFKKSEGEALKKWQTRIMNDSKAFKITREEERAVNRIDFSVYKSYLKLGSGMFKKSFIPLLILMMILSTFCSIFTNTWLSFWTSHKFAGKSDHFYIAIYVMFAILSVIFLVLEFWMLVYFFNTAARRLNLMAIGRVLHTPMSYIDTTPMGRILNRFTKDTDVCDNELIAQYRMFINPFCQIIGTMILCIVYLPWFAIAVPGLTFVYVGIAGFYQASAREVKRLEAVQRSFVYSHFSESLGGMNTIKAHGASNRFLKHIDVLLNNQNEAYFITIVNQRWLSVNLDLVATAFTLLISFLCCFRVFNISASSTGLLLTYVLSMSGLLSLMLRALTQIENEMNSVERLNHYAVDLVQEPAYELPERDPSPDWPEYGGIVLEHVFMKYRPELPYILKDINLDIKPHQRYGFCGRTGAGKSTIMSCLYRLVEFEGRVTIDGVDISKLGLHKLRSKLCIIPQDPVLFAGSIRQNLDPFKEKSDELLWDALRRAGLIKESELAEVKEQHKEKSDPENAHMHKFHLEQYVEDDGTNFSLGERQLLALARALVRQSRILILDEATSSVDYETDSKIQHTIATEFSQCTILCIAHRLKTILTYDKIVVMDAGQIKEFGKPLELFNDKSSTFRSMCDQSHLIEKDFELSVDNF